MIRRQARLKEYTVIVIKERGRGYWVQVPALPGCYTTADSVDEALRNAREAIESHIMALREDGQEVPTEAVSVVGKVKVAA